MLRHSVPRNDKFHYLLFIVHSSLSKGHTSPIPVRKADFTPPECSPFGGWSSVDSDILWLIGMSIKIPDYQAVLPQYWFITWLPFGSVTWPYCHRKPHIKVGSVFVMNQINSKCGFCHIQLHSAIQHKMGIHFTVFRKLPMVECDASQQLLPVCTIIPAFV